MNHRTCLPGRIAKLPPFGGLPFLRVDAPKAEGGNS